MREVAANAMSFLREAAELEGIDFALLMRGVPGYGDAGPAQRFDWPVYATALDRLEARVGLDGVERIGARTAKSSAAESIRTIAGAFIGSRQLYKAIVRWFAPAALSHLEYEYAELTEGRVRITIRVPEPYRPCRAFFHLAAGSYRTGPSMLRQPDAVVELDADERSARFTITPPPDFTFYQRVRRALRVAVGAERAIEELSHQQQAVQLAFRALSEKHTALEIALDRVKQSESSLGTLLDSIGDAVIATDRDGRVTRMNPVAASLTGVLEIDAIGQPFARVFRLLHEDSREPLESPSLVEADGIVGLPSRALLISSQGLERPIALSAAPIRAGSRAATGVVIVFRDITAALEAERALRRNEALFRSLLDAAPDALVLSNHEGLIVRVSSRTEELFGYDRSELLGEPAETLIAPRSLGAYRAERQRFSADPRPGTMTRDQELTGRRKDGSELPVEISRSPLVSESGHLVLAAFRDLTERRTLEQQVQHAQKMDAIGRLAGGIAHDFNNLLAAMMSFTNFALESLPESSPARDDLSEVLRAAERARALIRQLLAFSRQQVIDPRVIDARELVAGMEKLLQRILGEDIELVTSAASDLGMIEIDPSQFEQILVNLAANARDAMPRGGRLDIQLSNFAIDDEYAAGVPGLAPGRYIELAIGDTGSGMPDAVRARIFEPFFTTKPSGLGSGLGLATCYGIVRQLGGHIGVETRVGHGTTMRVYFPLAVGSSKSESRTLAPPSARGGAETVLVVEDDPAVRAAAVRSLTRRGYRVLDAPSAEAALAVSALHPDPIDVLLTDLVMPNMGGRDLAVRLVAERPSLRVVYMSGYAEHTVFQHGVLEPGVVFLQKPFVPDDLVRRIREALDAPLAASFGA